MTKNLVVGIVLILVALGLLYYWPNIFLWPMVSLIEGAIVPFIAFIGLIFLLIGWDEMKAPVIEEKPPAKRRRRKRR